VAWGIGAGGGQPLAAAPLTLAITPANTRITIRVHLLGVIPFEGQFTRFEGRLRLDPDRPGFCAVTMHIDTQSLVMRAAAAENVATGPAFLDVQHYPRMDFSGTCRDVSGPHGFIAGELHLRDRDGPLILTLSRRDQEFAIEGTLERARWGMTGHPLLTSGVVHIEVRTRILTANAAPP
jgi:polyisoprenoid-binding protein YceI